jgi:hypothetical protein
MHLGKHCVKVQCGFNDLIAGRDNTLGNGSFTYENKVALHFSEVLLFKEQLL